VRFVIQLSPLYQAVALIRGITLDQFSPSMLIHVGYLIALTIAGLALASKRMGKKLLR
jgi:lipooligosaccharide transport system permease protein